MNYLVFIIGALSGGVGVGFALWKKAKLEMLDNIRLRAERDQAYGKGYQEGFVTGGRVRHELVKVRPEMVLFVDLKSGVLTEVKA